MNGESDTTRFGPALKAWVALSRAFEAVERHTRAHIESHGLTVSEFGVLEALYHKGPMVFSDIKERILVSNAGITYLVDRLEERGLVERRPHPEDRRVRLAALTGEGEELLDGIFPEHARCIDHAFSGLDSRDREEIRRLLVRLGRTAEGLEPCSSSE